MSVSKRHWFRYSLRSLLLFMLVGMGWLRWRIERAEKQKAAVDAFCSAGGNVWYDFHLDENGQLDEAAEPSEPSWWLDWVGEDFSHDVVWMESFPPILVFGPGPDRDRDSVPGFPLAFVKSTLPAVAPGSVNPGIEFICVSV